MDSRSSALRPSGMTRGRLPAAPFEAGSGAEKKKGPGGRRKSLKRLHSAKESEGFNLDFVPPDLEFVPPGLDFVPKNLDFRQQEPSPGFSDAPTSRACLAITSPKTFPRGSCRPVYVKRTFAAVFHLHEEGSRGNLRRTALIVDRLAEKAAKLAVKCGRGRRGCG